LPTGASRGGPQPRFLDKLVQPGSWFFPRSARYEQAATWLDVEPAPGLEEAGPLASLVARAEGLTRAPDPKLEATVKILNSSARAGSTDRGHA
jgi:hypothetical protein